MLLVCDLFVINKKVGAKTFLCVKVKTSRCYLHCHGYRYVQMSASPLFRYNLLLFN